MKQNWEQELEQRPQLEPPLMLELNPKLDRALKQKYDLGQGLARRLDQELMQDPELAPGWKLK